jgi:hypothetical protein
MAHWPRVANPGLKHSILNERLIILFANLLPVIALRA